ncbi:MAG: hypothetical protein O7G88_02420 [bacterium]|nr:hypothetical protein [bacterium]
MQNMTVGPVLVVKEGATAKLILNRAEKKNALNSDMLHALAASLQAAIADAAAAISQADYCGS